MGQLLAAGFTAIRALQMNMTHPTDTQATLFPDQQEVDATDPGFDVPSIAQDKQTLIGSD